MVNGRRRSEEAQRVGMARRGLVEAMIVLLLASLVILLPFVGVLCRGERLGFAGRRVSLGGVQSPFEVEAYPARPYMF